jgi:hypothetical protein
MSGQRAGSVYVPLGGKLVDGEVVGRDPRKKTTSPKFLDSLSKIKKAREIGTGEEPVPAQEPSPELTLGQLFEDTRQANLRDQETQSFAAPQAPAPPPLPGDGLMMGLGQSARMDPRLSRGFDPNQLEMLLRNRQRGIN